jgi:putative oxidoreductase
MKIVALIARILLGLIFLVFGLNGFFNFLHGALPGGMAGTFLGALIHSHYVYFVSGIQLIAGILLLIDRYVPLALVLLGAEIANILVFHLTMNLAGIPVPILVAILWAIVVWRFRASLAPLFASKPTLP